MRIIHTSDWHFGKSLEGNSRLEEQRQFADFFVEKCREIKPDLVIIAGDIYDTPNPPALAEKLFYDTIKKISSNGECMSLIIAGNHDNPERLVAAWPLATEHGIVMLGSPRAVAQTGQYGNHQIRAAGEGYIEIDINGERAVILAVSYPSEKRLNEIIYKDTAEEEERLLTYGEKIKEIFKNLENNFRPDTINITTSHLFAFGAEEAGSERSISLGGNFIVPTAYLPQSAQYTALGHIHKPQVLPETKGKMIYSGSPIHYNKSEPKTSKKIFEINVRPGEEAHISSHEIPVFKPIEIWKADSIDHALDLCVEKQKEESWVYLEIKTDRYLRDDEIKRIKALKADILEIKPVIEAVQREMELEKISEMTFLDQFREFYKSQKNTQAPDEIIAALVSILEEDEDEAN